MTDLIESRNLATDESLERNVEALCNALEKGQHSGDIAVAGENLLVTDDEPTQAVSASGTDSGGDGSPDRFPPAGAECRANHGTGKDSTQASLTKSETWRVTEGNRRMDVLKTFNALVKKGTSKKNAARAVGESETTIWRWRKAFEKKGFNGLLPDTHKCGRKTILEKLGVPQEVVDMITGLNLDTESTTSALRVFAQSDRCPADLAAAILDPNRSSKHALPPSLRRLVTPSQAERDAHRGPRTLALNGAWTPRKLDILPGDIFCADDTTPIWAWWVPWVTNEEYPHGEKLLQGQLLPVIDVASQKLLTFALIAREQSSYRASDIWALFGHTFENVGVPRLGWQLERGSWEAGLIAGQEVEYRAGEVTLSRRVGGLRQLPTNITDWHRKTCGENFPFPKTLQTWTSYLPKSKSIEAFFNRSQTLEATLWGSLGRDQMRRPYEKMKKLYNDCRRPGSKEKPSNHFLSQLELITRIRAMWEYINNEPMEGDVFSGVPHLKWELAINEYPLLDLSGDHAWLYKRDWSKSQVDGAHVRVRLTHEISGDRYSLFYTNPTVFARRDVAGQEVVVYYDKVDFEKPAQIILARTGEYLCEANYFDRTGSFLQGDKSGHDIRRQWKNAVMAGYGTISKYAPSRQVPEEIKARREAAAAAPQNRGGAPAPATRPLPQIPTVQPPVRRSNVPLIID